MSSFAPLFYYVFFNRIIYVFKGFIHTFRHSTIIKISTLILINTMLITYVIH